MKKVLLYLIISLSILTFNVKALSCTEHYIVNLTILGSGSVIDVKNDIEYTHDTSFKVECGTNLTIALNPSSDYSVESLKESSTLISGEIEQGKMTYHINGGTDLYLVATFKSNFEEKTVNDGNETLVYLPTLNKLKVQKNNNYVEVNFDNIKGIIDEKTIYNVNLSGLDLTFDHEFLNNVKNSLVKVSANKVSRNALAVAQQNAIKSGLYYDFNVLVNGEKQHNLPGKVSIEIPCSLENGIVYYVDDDGNKEKIDSTYENGVIKFNTDHVSIYAIEFDEETKTKGLFNQETIFTIIIIVAFVIYLIVDFFKKNKLRD